MAKQWRWQRVHKCKCGNSEFLQRGNDLTLVYCSRCGLGYFRSLSGTPMQEVEAEETSVGWRSVAKRHLSNLVEAL